jgi:integrase
MDRAQYRAKGRTRRQTIGDYEKLTAEQARTAAKLTLAKVALGEDPQGEKQAQRLSAARTLRSVADDYLALKQSMLRPGSYRMARLYLLGGYFKPLHSSAITDITRADVASRLNTIVRDNGRVTARSARSMLSSLFTWSLKQGITDTNPVVGTEEPRPATARERVLSDPELVAIWRACGDGDFGKIVRLLALTACRREEIGGLRWSEIKDDGTITLWVKNKHEHTLPLTPMALEIVRSVPHRVGRDHLFGERSANGFTGWDRAKNDLDSRLKLSPWRLHDLRRSVATWMAEHGNVEPHIIEAILNHYSGHRSGVAGVYNRATYARQIRAALSQWDDHLRSLIEGGDRKIVPLRA